MKGKILVTGAGGFIGSVATYLLLKADYNVVAVDNFVTGYHEPLVSLSDKFGPDRLTTVELDLQKDLSPLFENHPDIEAVLHYAASCLVDESMSTPEKYFKNNIGSTLNLVENLVKYNIPRIIFSSTCAVYGEAQYVPVDEKHPIVPSNPYGESKRIAESIIQWMGRLKGLQYVILRYFNVCGASDDGLIGDSKKPSTLLMQNAVRGALGIEPFALTCPEVDTPDKTPIRDYINVVDLNTAHIKALEYLSSGGSSEIINLGTGHGNSVLEIVDMVKQKTGATFDLTKGQPRAGEYAKMIASIEKAGSVLGWKPERTLEQSVESLITWYKAHPNGWER